MDNPQAAACAAECANSSLKDRGLRHIIVLFILIRRPSCTFSIYRLVSEKITREHVLHDLSHAWRCIYTVRLTLQQLL